jgi:hypothetical protein
MTDYTTQIEQINAARSLDEIHAIARLFPAQALSDGAILYTGKVGSVDANVIAQELARKTGLPIINGTPRAQFLSNGDVEKAIGKSTERILAGQGVPSDQIERSASDFLYGNSNSAPESPLSVKNSLWGEASAEFASSVRGHVVVVASAANAERVLAQAEVPTVLNVNQAASLGGHSLPKLQELHAKGGMHAVLPEVQASFIDASTKGIFIDPSMVGKQVTQVAVSREVATTLNLDGSKFVGAAALSEAGFVPAPIAPTVPAATIAAVPRVSEVVRPYAAEAASLDYAARIHPAMVMGAGIVGGAPMAYDAYQTAQQYQALSARGNTFGADALLRQYEGRTAGGVLGGMVAGATYGAVAGSESGPGALVTGAVGGVLGAFAGDKIATVYNEHQVNQQTGTDGVTYAYANGQWSHTETHFDWSQSNLDGSPGAKSVTTAAPAAQLATLNYQRTTAAAELAMANPATQDTKNITLDGADWHASRQGWTKEVQQTTPGLFQADEFGRPITVSEPADAKTAKQLDQIAANRQYNNAHYKEAVAQAYVMDYYGNGWNQHGPLPEAITSELKRPSETHIKDPVTGNTWTADGKGGFSRAETTVGYDTPVTTTVKAEGAELARVGKLQQEAVQSNAAYGSQLIAEKYTQLQQPLTPQQASAQSEPSRPSDHAAVNPTVAAPSPFFREMSAKLDRFDQAMQSGDRAAVMKEVAHVERSPPWQADYGRARETVAREQQQREQQRAENPRDPRDVGHPDHAMNQSIRRQVETLHERAGYFISNKELDHLTASVANDARQRGMTRVDHVEFSSDKNQLIATQQNGPQDIFAKHSATNIQQAMQAPPEYAYQQMAQETQRQAQVQQGIQQQAAQSQQPAQSPGR